MKFLRKWQYVFYALAFAVAYPLLDINRQDITVSYPSELWLLIAFHAFISVLFLVIYTVTLRRPWSRLLATMLAMFALMQHFNAVKGKFTFLVAFLPPAGQAIALTIFVLAGIWLGATICEELADRWVKNQDALLTILAFACISVFVLNAYGTGKYLLAHHKASAYVPKTAEADLKSSSDRDIYYFVYDRYGNESTIRNYMNYDNSPIIQSLRNEGFVPRSEAYSNYQFTAASVASTLRMGYHTDMSRDLAGPMPVNSLPYKTLIESAPVSKQLNEKGYEIYNFGNWWNVTRKGYESKNVLPEFELTMFNKVYLLSEMQGNALERTFLYRIFESGLTIGDYKVLRIEFGGHPEIFVRQVNDLKKLAGEKSDKPKFVFAHLLMPHPPYVFTENGEPAKYNGDDSDVDIKREEKYVNQLKYTNKTIEDLVRTIKQKSDKPPIIVIQADEGPYTIEPVPKWQEASEDQLKLKFGTLATYYLPDSTEEEVAQIGSNVNIFRYVFNKYFGASMPMLPDCSFVYNNDRPFDFYNVTDKLHEASPECAAIHNAK